MKMNSHVGRLAVLTIAALLASTAAAQEIADSWQYTLRKPAAGWQQPEFEASGWKESSGGFGTPGTPAARIGTHWNTPNIWLRKSFELKSIPEKPALLIHHDEDAEVFLNGTKIVGLPGWSTKYEVLPLGAEQRSALRVGKNVMAVHCRQNTGGQFIDVHVVDADKVPTLPAARRPTKPYESELITKWGAEVTPENAWTEYPRPQMARKDWQNLNGQWDYAVTADDRKEPPQEWAGKILVPFALEAKLGGVQRLLFENEALWYRRTFAAMPQTNERLLLHFEAVDYLCEAFVNGQSVGKHQGGNTPFSFDITAAIRAGENTLILRVEDDTEGYQLHGKQVIDARGIWYTQVSGIWQTVWLESVPKTYIEDLAITTAAATGSITVRTDVAGGEQGKSVRLVVKDGDTQVAEATGALDMTSVMVPNARLWSPASPQLYNLEITLLDAAGKPLDHVESYAGIRTVGKRRDKAGNLRFTLNGAGIFHWGPLDQGWWPDGLLTPPSDEAMLSDIEFLKAAGFNMIRKHIKVEPRRYYYHCDRLGMLLWQDQVSASHNPPWTRLQPKPTDAQWPDAPHRQFMLELERMIDNLENHPSIVVWVPFNEAWGQHRTMEVGKWVAQRDPTRHVNVASGGNFWPVGDIVDQHSYPHPAFPFDELRFHDFVKVEGEFGGHGYPVPGHLWNNDNRNWGYGGLPKTKEEYRERYTTSLEKLNELRRQGVAAGVYTQTTDVEGEVNGLLTYDRQEIKIPAKELAKLHEQLFRPLDEKPAVAKPSGATKSVQ
jgi:beta-galactosidase